MGIDPEMLRQIGLLVQPLSLRQRNMIARVSAVHLVDDSTKLQGLQIEALKDEVIPDGEHFQPYGFTSVPLAGAEGVALFPSGDRAHPLVVVVSDRRYLPTGADPGTVTVYNHTGASITITKDGDIVATPAPGRKILAGGADASVPPALSSELADLKSRIAAWVPVPNDGGASLQPVFAAWPVPGATKVDVT